MQGIIRLNDILLLGPDSTGAFQPVPIKSIHRKRLPVKEVRAGQTASFSLKKVGCVIFIYLLLHLLYFPNLGKLQRTV